MRTPVFFFTPVKSSVANGTRQFQETDRDRRPVAPRAVVVKTVPPVPAGL